MSTQPSMRSLANVDRPPATRLRREVTAYLVLAFGFSWIPWAALVVGGADIESGVGVAVFALAAAGPSWAALALRISGHRRPCEFRTHWSAWWPVAALLLAGLPAVIAAALAHAGDLGVLHRHAASTIADVGGPLAALAYTLISGPLSEEFGWRGFLQPRLRRRLGRLAAVLVIGAVWGAWHLPLFFLDGTGQHDEGLVSVAGLLFLLTLFPLSYLILAVSEGLRGGVWAAIVAHAAFNLSDALVPDPGTLAAVVETAVFFVFAAGGWAVWRRSDQRTNRA
jgi:uncharacterized protein